MSVSIGVCVSILGPQCAFICVCVYVLLGSRVCNSVSPCVCVSLCVSGSVCPWVAVLVCSGGKKDPKMLVHPAPPWAGPVIERIREK